MIPRAIPCGGIQLRWNFCAPSHTVSMMNREQALHPPEPHNQSPGFVEQPIFGVGNGCDVLWHCPIAHTAS